MAVSAGPARRLDLAWAFGLMLAFLVLAGVRLEAPAGSLNDEVFHAKAGMELARGHAPSELTHPPLLKDFIAASLRATGVAYDLGRDVPVAGAPLRYDPGLVRAWRWPSVLGGALGVGLVYALARALLGSTGAAAAAAILVGLDGCYFVHARVAQTNVFEAAFVVAAALGAWQAVATGKDRWLALAGLALGASIACRWSGGAAWLLLGAWLAWTLRAEPRRLLALAAAWTALPLAVYVAAYVPLVLQAGSLLDPANWVTQVWGAQARMYRFHAQLAEIHAYQSAWWSWPLMLRPMWYGFWIGGPTVIAVWAIGNAAIWWASVPALALAAAAGLRGRPALGFVAWLGLGMWVAWGLQPRSLLFMHYYLTVIPFACIALAAIGRAWWRGEGLAGGAPALEPTAGRVAVGLFGVAVVAWFAYYYPVLAGWPISEAALRGRVWFGPGWL